MKIDMQIEPLVRQTIHAVVQRDVGKLETALQGFPDGDTTAKGVEIAAAVTTYVLLDGYGGKPAPDQVQTLSRKIAEMEEWAEPGAEEIAAYVTALVDGKPLEDVLPKESIVVLAYLVAGSLLSSTHREDEKWWDFLDRAEAAVDSTSGRN